MKDKRKCYAAWEWKKKTANILLTIWLKEMKHKWNLFKVTLCIINNSAKNIVIHNPYYKLLYSNYFAKVYCKVSLTLFFISHFKIVKEKKYVADVSLHEWDLLFKVSYILDVFLIILTNKL